MSRRHRISRPPNGRPSRLRGVRVLVGSSPGGAWAMTASQKVRSASGCSIGVDLLQRRLRGGVAFLVSGVEPMRATVLFRCGSG